jgi:hypothetical protein
MNAITQISTVFSHGFLPHPYMPRGQSRVDALSGSLAANTKISKKKSVKAITQTLAFIQHLSKKTTKNNNKGAGYPRLLVGKGILKFTNP